MTQYAVAKFSSMGSGRLYRLRDGYYTFAKAHMEIEIFLRRSSAQGAARNLTVATGKHHFAAKIERE